MNIIKIFFVIFLSSSSVFAEDQIFIDVGQAQVKKSLLALPPLQYAGTQPTNHSHIDAGQNLFRVIYNDLAVSNFFTFVKPEAYLEDPNKLGLRPAPGQPNGFNFKNWATIGTEFLIRASYSVIGKDISVEAYVYHVPTTKQLLGKTYKGPVSATRKIAHTFANDIVHALTGKQGPFLTKFTASRQVSIASLKEIYVADWDGASPQKISSHDGIAISPTWSSDGTRIAYTAYAFHKHEKVRNADLFVYDLKSGKRFLTSYRKGLNSGACYAPGDKYIFITLSKSGNADIYRLNSDGDGEVRITNGPNRAMNVECAVSPDGKTIAFSSDRSGRPMIYTMNIDGSGVKRLTYAGKYNSTPAWSPDGKSIAFAALDVDHFDIFTMTKDGSNLKRMTAAKKPNGRAANNESPSWSPDGRAIMFSSDRTGKNQIYIIAPDGTNERRVTDDNYNWDKPKWSPYLD
jgi:TolB protein